MMASSSGGKKKTSSAAKPAPGGAREELRYLTLQEWVRKRPDTFIGPVAPCAELRWVVGWRHELEKLDFARRPATLDDAEYKKLAAQQVRPPAPEPLQPAGTQDGPAGREADTDDADDADDAEDADVADVAEDAAGGPGRRQDAKKSPAQAGRKPTRMKDAGAACVLTEFSPAAEKVVDEILQNMADRPVKDSKMRRIDVWVHEDTGVIRARNDGFGMPVTKPDAEENPEAPDEWWPTILFTRTMAGGNFVKMEDMEQHQGGRNGIGAKATNVCSRRFKVKVADPVNHRTFQQEWFDGMTRTTGATVRSYKGGNGYVDIEFEPDMAYFMQDGAFGPGGAAGLAPDFAAVVRSRVWELAAVTPDNIGVYLNGTKLPVKNLSGFTKLFIDSAARPAHTTFLHRGKVVFDATLLPASGALPAGVIGFVNGVRCSKGKHVGVFFSKLRAALEPVVRRKAKLKDLSLRSAHVSSAVFLVLSVRIDGPRFASQTKDKLDSGENEWGFRWEPDEEFVKRVGALCADAIAARFVLKSEADALREANRSAAGHGRRSVALPKYEKAGDAEKPFNRASLVLTEGDSAKALAMAGRAVTGSRYVGVFCLKGKPMNPRGKKMTSVVQNKELSAVAQILGLKYGQEFKKEDDLRALNYWWVELLADQDVDGGHITGLVINWLVYMWPSLFVLRPDFIRRFATPLVIARKKKSAKVAIPELRFLAKPKFQEWLRAFPADIHAYRFQYYKGLGGHSSKMGREYFSQRDSHVVTVRYEGEADRETLADFFDAKRAKARRAMLDSCFDPMDSVDYTAGAVSMERYLKVETLAYSDEHNHRSIPGVDGLKWTQRKLVWAARELVRPGRMHKLQTLAMECAKRAYYHHGDASLYSTMVGMGQVHVGTNNVNLFKCDAQFGSRHAKRSVFTAPRYLSTGLCAITNKLFRKEDDPILTYTVEDGDRQVEPVHFWPVVPVDMLNGCQGVGTGYKTDIPPFHPLQVADVFLARIRGDDDWRDLAYAMLPWYDNFTGMVEATDKEWVTYGLYHLEEGDTTTNVVLSDLPIGTWVNKYQKKVLKPLMATQPGGFILKIESDTTDTRIRYTLVCDSEKLYARLGDEREECFMPDERGFANSADRSLLDQAAAVYALEQRRYPVLEDVLKLRVATKWTEMNRFDDRGAIVHYARTEDLVDAYYGKRLAVYAERLGYQAGLIERDACRLENKIRFIEEVTSGSMDPMSFESDVAWWTELAARGYVHDKDPRIMPPPKKLHSDIPELVQGLGGEVAVEGEAVGSDDDDDDDEDEEGHDDDADGDGDGAALTKLTYKYLTGMQISTLTRGKRDDLQKQLDKKLAELEATRKQTPEATWTRELEEFKAEYVKFAAERAAANRIEQQKAAQKGGKKPAKKTRKKVARPLDMNL